MWLSRQEHPGLKPYFDAGMLDSAIFDAVKDTHINLSHSNKVCPRLTPGAVQVIRRGADQST